MKTAIVWLRRDLRIDDNPALLSALEAFDRVIPLYIHNPLPNDPWVEGGASRWWLHYSLEALDGRLKSLGSGLVIRVGDVLAQLTEIVRHTKADAVFWNRLYNPSEIYRDTDLKAQLRSNGLQVQTFNSALLKEPWGHLKPNKEPYRVFTPFWKAYLAGGFSIFPEDPPQSMPPVPEDLASVPLVALNLLPRIPWDQGLRKAWEPGELSANRKLDDFLRGPAGGYADSRDFPGVSGTSRLSPHLHFGEISPRRIASEIGKICLPGDRGVEVFMKEVGWREFGHHLLFHFPHTDQKPLDERFNAFPWPSHDDAVLERWKRGLTGYPIVDAGMRELWHTGWMHNRVRMIVASFLTKNLMIHWFKGAEWFWDTLVDADLASNTLGWQWTAGCGADASPYFRIFNPILQGEKFDGRGAYIRHWIPELSQVPDQWIHHPFDLSMQELESFGVVLGQDYPQPIVELKGTRERALAAFAAIKSSNAGGSSSAAD